MRICEIFYSLQGEGTLIGVPTTFIRTTGCNLDCRWCDTVFAREEGEEMSVPEIIREVDAKESPMVCVTGGEPLLQKGIYRLLESLLSRSYHVTLETNGSLPLDEVPCNEMLMISMDLKCPSSGMWDQMLMENIEVLSPYDQLKFVIAGDEDMDHVREVLGTYDVNCPVIVTPVGGMDLRPLAEWALDNRLQVRVLPQLHKIIWGERRGV